MSDIWHRDSKKYGNLCRRWWYQRYPQKTFTIWEHHQEIWARTEVKLNKFFFIWGPGFCWWPKWDLYQNSYPWISKYIDIGQNYKKSCWDSEFSSHFGCVQHPHPHFHIMFYSMQFPFSKPPTDWLYLGYSGPGVSGKGFLGNWKSHSRFKRNTGRERELENATGREGKFEARNPGNPGNHITSKVKFKI